MSRRRSKDPTTAISITLTRSILDKIDNSLTRTQSRSAWIALACQARLDNNDQIDLSTRQLMAMLHARVDDETLKTLLLDRLTS
jgi:metal-responsive CopG/Arc/MetJ family transcriptional regulator